MSDDIQTIGQHGHWWPARMKVWNRSIIREISTRKRRLLKASNDVRVFVTRRNNARKPRVSGDRCIISTSTQTIIYDTPQRRWVSSHHLLQKCSPVNRTKWCIDFNAPIQLSRAPSVRDLFKWRSSPLNRCLAEPHSLRVVSLSPEDRRTRQASSKALTNYSRR